jgi:hypothetical protein
MYVEINYWAILVSAVVSMIVGFLWYGPLFGKIWKREIIGPKEDVWAYYLIQFILSIITAWALVVHVANWANGTPVIAIAICTWFGFVMTTNAGAALWSGKPKMLAWKMFLISSGAQLVTFIIFGIIINLFK